MYLNIVELKAMLCTYSHRGKEHHLLTLNDSIYHNQSLHLVLRKKQSMLTEQSIILVRAVTGA